MPNVNDTTTDSIQSAIEAFKAKVRAEVEAELRPQIEAETRTKLLDELRAKLLNGHEADDDRNLREHNARTAQPTSTPADAIAHVLRTGEKLGIRSIEERTGLDRSVLQYHLRALKADKRVRQYGSRRGTTYKLVS